MSNRMSAFHWKVAETPAPPTGIVTEQVFPEEDVQPVQLTKLWPDAGVAVRPTDAPTGNSEIHCVGQLIPPVKLVTVPGPTTCTPNSPSVPPPGQVGSVGSLTVTVAYAVTMFAAPPVPSGIVAEMFAPPQPAPVVVAKPSFTVTKLSSAAQVAWLVTSMVAGGWI
jgi:hypothetical protein